MEKVSLLFPVLPFFVAVKIGFFFIFRIYKMTWRYVGLYDFLSIFIATVTATFVLMLSMLLPVDLPLSGFSKRVVLADGIITLFLISGLRVAKRIYREVLRERRLKNRGGKRTLIVGAGNAGEMILRDMMKQELDHFLPVGFLDDDQMKAGAYIHGIKVLGGTNELEGVVSIRDVEVVLLAIPTLNHQKLRDLYNAAKKAGVSDIKIASRASTTSTGRISTCAIWRRSASRICSASKALPFPTGPILCYTGREDDSNETDNPQGWGVRR